MSTQSKPQFCRDDATSPARRPRRLSTAARVRQPASLLFAGDRRAIILGAIRAADVAAIVLAGVASYAARHGSLAVPALYWWQILTGSLIAAAALHGARVYTFHSLRQPTRHLARVALTWIASALIMIAMLFFARVSDEISRVWLLLWALAALAGLASIRLACQFWLAHWSKSGKLILHVAVVGPAAAAAARRIEQHGADDTRVLGVFCPRSRDGDELEELAKLARSVRVDEVLIALPCVAGEEVHRALRTLGALPADVKLCFDLGSAAPAAGGLSSTHTLLISRRPLAGWRIVVKRAMDVALGAALLLLFAPLMAVLAVLVKLDSKGPAIFRQRRFGFNKQPFTVYKFRTMFCDADDPAVPQARRGDPRVTRLGRFLRRTSLDELPQIFNVLAGSMSLVGPRPHAIIHDEKYAALIDGYLARHRVLPGITGWAQVNGLRGETDTTEKMARRIEHDIFYIDHWSPLLDMRILLRTLRIGFGDRRAY